MTGKPNSLRVLMVATRSFPYTGGVETHIREVGRRLVKAGVEVTILSTDLSGQLPPTEEVDGMLTHRVPAWPTNKDYYFAPGIYRFINQGRWDIVHCQGYHNFVAPMTMLAAKKNKMPYVVTFHSGGESFRLRKMLRGIQRMALRPLLAQAERLIGPSKWEVEFFRKKLHLPRKQFAVIPNGAYHLPDGEETVQGMVEGKLVVSIGRLEKYKGHQRVIAALPMVQKQVPDVRLRIVGVGPYESTLRKMASELKVAEHVEIRPVPPGDDGGMASLIKSAHLVTLLSEHEAQGIAVLEALALHRPVLVANTTALQDFVDLGFAPGVSLESSPETVAQAMISQLYKPMIPTNIALPTWDDCANELLALYQGIAGKKLCVS